MRITKDDYYMGIARQAARLSTCDRAEVGAVVVVDDRVIATGYNGAPRGARHCDEVGHLMRNGHCVRTVHAEANAVLFAGLASCKGGMIYCTHFPCLGCANLIATAGIRRVVYENDYRLDEDVATLFRELEIELVKVDD